MLAVVHEDYKKLNASGGTTVILSDHWYMDCCFSKIIWSFFLGLFSNMQHLIETMIFH